MNFNLLFVFNICLRIILGINLDLPIVIIVLVFVFQWLRNKVLAEPTSNNTSSSANEQPNKKPRYANDMQNEGTSSLLGPNTHTEAIDHGDDIDVPGEDIEFNEFMNKLAQGLENNVPAEQIPQPNIPVEQVPQPNIPVEQVPQPGIPVEHVPQLGGDLGFFGQGANSPILPEPSDSCSTETFGEGDVELCEYVESLRVEVDNGNLDPTEFRSFLTYLEWAVRHPWLVRNSTLGNQIQQPNSNSDSEANMGSNSD